MLVASRWRKALILAVLLAVTACASRPAPPPLESIDAPDTEAAADPLTMSMWGMIGLGVAGLVVYVLVAWLVYDSAIDR